MYSTMGGLGTENELLDADYETRKRCIQELDELLMIDPLNLETLHTRALLFLVDDNLQACREDLLQTLAVERRHFPSLQTLFRMRFVLI